MRSYLAARRNLCRMSTGGHWSQLNSGVQKKKQLPPPERRVTRAMSRKLALEEAGNTAAGGAGQQAAAAAAHGENAPCDNTSPPPAQQQQEQTPAEQPVLQSVSPVSVPCSDRSHVSATPYPPPAPSSGPRRGSDYVNYLLNQWGIAYRPSSQVPAPQ